MIEDRLRDSLLSMGFQRVASNAQGIYLYYYVGDYDLTMIPVILVENGNEYMAHQYEHILDQMKSSIQSAHPQRIKLLSLLLTGNPDNAKQLIVEAKQDNHWIIDTRTDRLIIYENQSEEFTQFRKLLEQLLEEEFQQKSVNSMQNQSAEGNYGQTGLQGSNNTNRFAVTPATASLIALNLIVYLITHFTPLYGGAEGMLTKGALSWYDIRIGHEYYRVFTSMFMHADWSHLINNMIVLLFIGGNLEKAAGRIKFLIIYFGAGILAGISSISYNMWKEYANTAISGITVSGTTISIGASGAIFGIVGAILYIVIINKGRLQEISMQQMIFFVILSLYSGVVNSHIDQAAHVGGFITGILLAATLYRKPTANRSYNSGL